jgi:SAM-dependent methyltransferase
VLGVEELAVSRIRSNNVYSERLPYIIDPSCGSGTFLLSAMQYITDHVAANRAAISGGTDDIADFLREKFPVGHENLWAKDFLFGVEYDETLATATKVNMVLRRDGNTHVYNADGLAPLASYSAPYLRGSAPPTASGYTKPVANSFDVVVSNPPFSITLDPATLAHLADTFELAGNSNSENLFLERWYQLLKPGGRLGVVLPESFFATKENLSARLFLFARFNVKAVVSLPRHAFEPWTPTRTSLLFAQKKTLEEERVWKRGFDLFSGEATLTIKAGSKAARHIVGTPEKVAERNAPLAMLVEEAGLPVVSVPTSESLASAEEAVQVAIRDVEAAFPAKRRPQPVTKLLRALQIIQRQLQVIGKAVADLRGAVEYFGLPIRLPDAATAWPDVVAFANEAKAALESVDARLWAFTKVVERSPDSLYVLNVENIGYKRTKRTEYERANDLFRAFLPPAAKGQPPTRIGNISLHPAGWRVEGSTEGSAGDALALLVREDLWG